MSTALFHCDQFNVIRAFNILALLFVGIALLPQLIFACSTTKNTQRWAKKTVLGLLISSALFGAISMAVTLVYFDQHPETYFGFSFWLQIIAWLTAFVGAYHYMYAGLPDLHSAPLDVINTAVVAKNGATAPVAVAVAGTSAAAPAVIIATTDTGSPVVVERKA
jgi:FlaA1/EpsC-like NDP-sugar epimerase